MKNKNPIGIFDSGVGGLTVAGEIQKQLPGEKLIYIADSRHAPYGDKTPEQIRHRVQEISRYLISCEVKALVVACNTATAIAIRSLRNQYSIPIIGMEPGLKPATKLTRSGVVGILATTGTLKSEKFSSLSTRFSSNVQIITQPCPGLVEQVEKGNLGGVDTRHLVKRYVELLTQRNADTIVLGCTHYPYLTPLIREYAGEGVEIIDTSPAVTRELSRQLESRDLINPGADCQPIRFLTSSAVNGASTVLEKLWDTPLKIGTLPEIVDRY